MKTLISHLLMLLLAAGLPAACAPTPLINFTDIPSLRDGPGQGHYAIFQGKLFDVLITTNLGLFIHPVENGKHSGPRIEIVNCHALPSEKLRIVSLVQPAPPAVNPAKLTFDFVSDAGVHVIQTWRIRDGSLLVENQVVNYPPERIPQLLISVLFPKTHLISTNTSHSERVKITAGCMIRWRGGDGGDDSMKIYSAPYANRVDLLGAVDWIEHKGPWGSRKLTLRRTNTKGYLQPASVKYAYDGLGLVFISRPDSRRKIELQGFELKIE